MPLYKTWRAERAQRTGPGVVPDAWCDGVRSDRSACLPWWLRARTRFAASRRTIDETPAIPTDVRKDAGMFVLLVGCTEYPHLRNETRRQAGLYEKRDPAQGV